MRIWAAALALIVASLGAADALAQRGPAMRDGAPAFGSERQIASITDQLSLNEQQQEQVRALFTSHRQAMMDWSAANTNATRADRMAFHQSQRTSLHAALIEILDADQAARLDAVFPPTIPQRRAVRPGRGADDRPRSSGIRGGRMDRSGLGARAWTMNESALASRLDLSDEQTLQLRQLRLDQRIETLTWLRDNADASAADRAAFLSGQRDAHRQAMLSLLTQEQVEQFDSLRTMGRATGRDVRARGRFGGRVGR